MADTTDLVRGDMFDPASLLEALSGVDTAYYLVHSLGSTSEDFYERELASARNFAEAVRAAGVRRVIYLGGLGRASDTLSSHLASRQDVGRLLCESGAETIEFRASVVLGSGSISFEMIRGLVDRVPVMITPKWVRTLAQPIAVEDVISYLVAALDVPVRERCTVYEIGGADRVSYAGMMEVYARSQGLRRPMIRVPWLTPRLSSGWLALVTPLYYRVGRHLLEGVRNETVVTSDAAAQDFPQIRPMDFEQAVHEALGRMLSDVVETSWSDALVNSAGDTRPYRFEVEEGMMIERRSLVLELPAPAVFRAYVGVGGERGWLFMDWAWAIRGWMDKAVGGVGIRRGRRHPDEIRAGESLDFWRVEAVEQDRRLLLQAEMKLPGKAWLQFESTPLPQDETLLVQTAYYAPRGVLGFLYWYAMWPFHAFLFDGLIRRIASRARMLAQRATSTSIAA